MYRPVVRAVIAQELFDHAAAPRWPAFDSRDTESDIYFRLLRLNPNVSIRAGQFSPGDLMDG